MELFEILDAKILEFFTKISHKFQRLTGKTNFFLAKLSCMFGALSILISSVNYWVPILARETRPFMFVSITFILAFFAKCMLDCDVAENKLFNSPENTRFQFSVYQTSFQLRMFWFFASTTIIPIYIYDLFYQTRGFAIFNLIDDSFAPAWFLLSYFLNVNPLLPGKSKIREWIDAFTSGIRKLIPVSEASQ